MSIPLDQVKIPAQAKLGRGTLNIPFDPEYTPGAFNAVNVCLRVQEDFPGTAIYAPQSVL